jgi:hypothetical protein
MAFLKKVRLGGPFLPYETLVAEELIKKYEDKM